MAGRGHRPVVPTNLSASGRRRGPFSPWTPRGYPAGLTVLLVPLARRRTLRTVPALDPAPAADTFSHARALAPLPRGRLVSSDARLRGGVHTHPQRCPPGCIELWIQRSRRSTGAVTTAERPFVHSMWVELSTVIHRRSVGCDIRVILGTGVDHNIWRASTNRALASVFPGSAVDTRRHTQSVDGSRHPLLCTRLWITVDDGPDGVDDTVLSGGRRVGTERLPTGRATFPQRGHRFVHTHLWTLTCRNTRFPRVPQPL